MTDVVVIDTNLLVLLVVGSAHRSYISKHKRLKDYGEDDFDLLVTIIAEFSEIILIPHVLSEVSSLARQIDNPARRKVQAALKTLIETCNELTTPSTFGAQRMEFSQFGLTDSILLHLCSIDTAGLNPTLLTTDTDLANSAHSLGYSVIDYRQEYQTK